MKSGDDDDDNDDDEEDDDDVVAVRLGRTPCTTVIFLSLSLSLNPTE